MYMHVALRLIAAAKALKYQERVDKWTCPPALPSPVAAATGVGLSQASFFFFLFPFFQRELRSQLSGGFLELTPLFYHPKLPICNCVLTVRGGGRALVELVNGCERHSSADKIASAPAFTAD